MQLSDRHVKEPIVIERGKGVWVWDEHGTPYIEAVAGMWCAAFGFGEEELVEAAITQLRKLPYYHTLTNKTVGPAVELAEKLRRARSGPPTPRSTSPHRGRRPTTSSSSSSATANNAIGETGPQEVHRRINGYHGATMGASSLTGIAAHAQALRSAAAGILPHHDPHFYRNGQRRRVARRSSLQRMADELDELISAEGPDTIAGFLAEPVTGRRRGGRAARRLLRRDAGRAGQPRHPVLRRRGRSPVSAAPATGSAAETFGITPTTMTLGKGLSGAYQPIAALVVSGDIYEAMEKGSDEVGTFAHGATYSGHPVAAAVALRRIS